MEREVYEAFKVQCTDKLKVLKLEEKMLTEQVERLGKQSSLAMEKHDMDEWEKVKTEAAKAEQELMKTIRQKRILMGELPCEEEIAGVFSQWEDMWTSMDVFDQASVVHHFIQHIDYNSAKGSLAISYEIK